MPGKLIRPERVLVEVGRLAIVLDNPVQFIGLRTLPVHVAIVPEQIDFTVAVVEVQGSVELG